MPLKLLFHTPPLMTPRSLPLRAGSFRCAVPWMREACRLAQPHAGEPEMWEGLIRLEEALYGAGRSGEAGQHALAAAGAMRRGEIPAGVPGLWIARAVWALYEIRPERELLEALMAWASLMSAQWEVPAAEDAPADWMELLEQLYRVTRKQALLGLCQRLRREMPDWGGILHTWNEDAPEAGAAPTGNEEYDRLLRCMTRGETLADGLRTALVSAMHSGSAQELSAARTAWERITRRHGAACGGFTAEESIGGLSPYAGVGTACLGAQAEALAAQVMAGQEGWAMDALERMLCNALPAAVAGGLQPRQRVNTRGGESWLTQEENVHALARLTRGIAAACAAAVCADADGLRVNLAVPGKYAVPMPGGVLTLTIDRQADHGALRLEVAQPRHAALRLRVPAWMRLTSLSLNDTRLACPRGGAASLQRTWQSGDTMRLRWHTELQALEGYHHSLICLRGPWLMAMPGETAEAACGEPWEENGQVLLRTRPLKNAPGKDLPVYPAVEGEDTVRTLVKYADAPQRVAMFPRGGGQ